MPFLSGNRTDFQCTVNILTSPLFYLGINAIELKMDFGSGPYDWQPQISKTNLMSTSHDFNRQSMTDQSSIMPADWGSIVEPLSQRRSLENNLQQLDSQFNSLVGGPAATYNYQTMTSIGNATSDIENGYIGKKYGKRLSQQEEDNIMRGIIKLNLIINQRFKFSLYKLRSNKGADRSNSLKLSSAPLQHKNYGSWSKIDTIAESPFYFQSSSLLKSGQDFRKTAGAGSIFADINRRDVLNRVVKRISEKVMKEAFQCILKQKYEKKSNFDDYQRKYQYGMASTSLDMRYIPEKHQSSGFKQRQFSPSKGMRPSNSLQIQDFLNQPVQLNKYERTIQPGFFLPSELKSSGSAEKKPDNRDYSAEQDSIHGKSISDIQPLAPKPMDFLQKTESFPYPKFQYLMQPAKMTESTKQSPLKIEMPKPAKPVYDFLKEYVGFGSSLGHFDKPRPTSDISYQKGLKNRDIMNNFKNSGENIPQRERQIQQTQQFQQTQHPQPQHPQPQQPSYQKASQTQQQQPQQQQPKQRPQQNPQKNSQTNAFIPHHKPHPNQQQNLQPNLQKNSQQLTKPKGGLTLQQVLERINRATSSPRAPPPSFMSFQPSQNIQHQRPVSVNFKLSSPMSSFGSRSIHIPTAMAPLPTGFQTMPIIISPSIPQITTNLPPLISPRLPPIASPSNVIRQGRGLPHKNRSPSPTGWPTPIPVSPRRNYNPQVLSQYGIQQVRALSPPRSPLTLHLKPPPPLRRP